MTNAMFPFGHTLQWFLLLTTNLNYSLSQWWIYSSVLSEGQYSKVESRRICNYYNLNEHQYRACVNEPRILIYIGKGTKNGLNECQRQFVKQRWNCSKSSFNNKFYRKRTPETAFVNAMSSAGVIHKVTQECDQGVLHDCNCRREEEAEEEGEGRRHMGGGVDKEDPEKWFYWSYCNSHIRYAMQTTRTFLDPSREETYVTRTRRSLKKLIVLQNNKAARKILFQLSKSHKKCACHGPTGQCISRTCYRWLPNLPVVGRKLYEKFLSAIQVKLRNKRKLTPVTEGKKLRKTDLVYTERFNYCDVEDQLGIPGTRGRLCSNHEPMGGDDMRSCKVLCCGRGYLPHLRLADVSCRCKFRWCCEVTCDTCKQWITEYRCK